MQRNLALDRIIKCDICADLIIFKRCRCTRIVIKKLPVCTIAQNFAVDKIDDGFTCYAATVAFFGNSINTTYISILTITRIGVEPKMLTRLRCDVGFVDGQMLRKSANFTTIYIKMLLFPGQLTDIDP